jgi:ferredoxin-thioredoxin reductase catalytic subunit
MPSDEQLLQEITQRVEEFAKEKGYSFSKSKAKILTELVKAYRRFGDYYCPCQIENAPHTVCPCLEVRTGYVEEEGRCH